ncbi:unnamed protein product, partial [Arabidopsis halleri]
LSSLCLPSAPYLSLERLVLLFFSPLNYRIRTVSGSLSSSDLTDFFSSFFFSSFFSLLLLRSDQSESAKWRRRRPRDYLKWKSDSAFTSNWKGN